MNECENASVLCGDYSKCLNTNGSFVCECLPGYKDRNGKSNFTTDGQCRGKCLCLSVSECVRPLSKTPDSLLTLPLLFGLSDINECTDYKGICGPFATCKNIMGSWDGPFLFQHDYTPEHKARSIKTWMSQLSPDLNPIEHLWDESEQRLRARLLEEWSKTPINTPKPCGKLGQKS